MCVNLLDTESRVEFCNDKRRDITRIQKLGNGGKSFRLNFCMYRLYLLALD